MLLVTNSRFLGLCLAKTNIKVRDAAYIREINAKLKIYLQCPQGVRNIIWGGGVWGRGKGFTAENICVCVSKSKFMCVSVCVCVRWLLYVGNVCICVVSINQQRRISQDQKNFWCVFKLVNKSSYINLHTHKQNLLTYTWTWTHTHTKKCMSMWCMMIKIIEI